MAMQGWRSLTLGRGNAGPATAFARDTSRLMAQAGLRAGMARPEPNRAEALCLDDLAGNMDG